MTTLITVDYFSLFTLRFSLYKNFGYPFSYAHHIHAGGQRKNMVAGGGVHRANERTYYIIYMYCRGLGQGEAQRAVGGVDAQAAL